MRIVNAITEFLISNNEIDNTKSKEILMFSKKDKKYETVVEEELKNIENYQIHKELTSISSKIQYKIKENPDYQIKVLEPTLTMKTSTYITIEKITDANIQEKSYTIANSSGEKEEKTISFPTGNYQVIWSYPAGNWFADTSGDCEGFINAGETRNCFILFEGHKPATS